MKKWQKNQKGVVGWGHQKGGWKSRDYDREKVKVERANFVELRNKSVKEKEVGRPNCLSVERKNALLSAYYGYPYSFRQLAEMFGVSRMTVWRAVQGEHYECSV